jgi:hypothetical protein
MPYDSPELTLEQTWPAALQKVTFGVEKVNDLKIASPQFATANDVRTGDGQIFILGSGPAQQAGATTSVMLSNLPIHSPIPKYTTLGLALALAGVGVWLSVTRQGVDQARLALVKRRDTLLSQLEQVESKHRAGTLDPNAYLTRRQRILTELERIYGELDDASAGPEGGGEGIAA